MRNRSVEQAAIDALNVGSDYLLLAAIDALNVGSDYLLLAAIDDQLERVFAAICEAVGKRELVGKRLSEAGAKIRAL